MDAPSQASRLLLAITRTHGRCQLSRPHPNKDPNPRLNHMHSKMAFVHHCEHIGKRVTRRFEGVNVGGKVIAWAPPDGQDEALYRVHHDDGDEEDLDRQELEDALALAAKTPVDLKGRFLAVPTSFFQVEAGFYLARCTSVSAGGAVWLRYGSDNYSHWVPHAIASKWLISDSEARRGDWVGSGEDVGEADEAGEAGEEGDGEEQDVASAAARREGSSADGLAQRSSGRRRSVPARFVAEPSLQGDESQLEFVEKLLLPAAQEAVPQLEAAMKFGVGDAVLGKFGPDDEGKTGGVLDKWYRAVVRAVNAPLMPPADRPAVSSASSHLRL